MSKININGLLNMNTPRRKSERITKAVSLSSGLAAWAEQQAARENRSLSNYIETLIGNLKKARAEADKQLQLEGVEA